ncbi:Glucuronoxylan 4-O-methyltransferase 2 [Linum grandiflorum]
MSTTKLAQQSAINNTKLSIFLCFFFLCLISLLLCFTSTTTNPLPPQPTASKTPLPPSIAAAIVHYAATNTTPQQTFKEISVTLRVLSQKSPCNFLIFGLGHDSLMWSSLNHGGRTVFLEENQAWIDHVRQATPPAASLEMYKVAYDTKLYKASRMMMHGMGDLECKELGGIRDSKCRLTMKGLPAVVYETEWDLIMIDAPTGYHYEAPGRMTAIYTAGLMARSKGEGKETEIFVHDVDRTVEDTYSVVFLCRRFLTEEEGRLRRFTVPGHRSGEAFCP